MELVLAQTYGEEALEPLKKPESAPMVVSSTGGRPLTVAEFQEGVNGLTEAFPEEHWELLNSFYDHFSDLVAQEKLFHHTTRQAILRVQEYLESEDPAAKNVRAFLGPEVATEDFSAILVAEVKSMTKALRFENDGKNSLQRVVMTNVANDMNRRRYVASVLFFGGRCCYCNCVLHKKPGPTQATGEHITPISPEEEGAPMGATRYGNMALACAACNQSRGNKELNSWMEGTDTVPPEEKPRALKRIAAFRRFALYEDYQPKQVEKLQAALAELKAKQVRYPRNHGKYLPKHFEILDSAIKVAVYDLQQELGK